MRDAVYQRIPVDASGNIVKELSYGRITNTPQDAYWVLSVWGKNLTDEKYINGGFDTRNVWGYDFSVVGRSREYGATVSVSFWRYCFKGSCG